MKNKFLIGTVTVFVAIIVNIIALNFLNSSSQQKNNFKRTFSKNEILIFNKSYKRLSSKNEYICKITSSDSIREFENYSVEKGLQIIKILTSDFNFLNTQNKFVRLPVTSKILSVNQADIIFSYKSKIGILNFKTGILKSEIIKNLKIFTLISLNEYSKKYLCFGELFQNNIYKTGFYIIDLSNQNIVESKILKIEEKSTYLESRLQYTGYFQKQNENLFSYNFEMFSKIFFFNNIGIFENELNTKDKTKLPKIITTKNIEFRYSNDEKGYSNVGLFCKNECFYVFSMAINLKDKIVIDKYSMITNKYIESFKLDYNGFNSRDITNIIIDKNKIIIAFSFYYASFTFSRYI